MSGFNRSEAIKKLSEGKRKKIEKYEKDLKEEISLAGLENEKNHLVDVLLDFTISKELTEHYRQLYNKQADLINKLLANKYNGSDFKKAKEWADRYSKEIAILNNLKYNMEEYMEIARGLASQARDADDRIDEKLRERGYLDEIAKAPRKGQNNKKNR